MESVNSNDTNLLEEGVTISALRRRNQRLILTFTIFMITLSLLIASLIFYLIVLEEENNTSQSNHQLINNSSTPSPDLADFNDPIITTEPAADPNQTYTLSLQTADKEIQELISFLSTTSYSLTDDHNETVISSFKNCSDSLIIGSGLIREVLTAIRDDPFVENTDEKKKGEMMNRIFSVEERLNACLRRLWKVESTTAAIEARERVQEAMVYVSSSAEFLASHKRYEYDEEVINWEKYFVQGGYWGWMVVENLFVICVCGLQLFFMFVLFWTLCRYR